MQQKILKFLKRHQGDFYKTRELMHHLMVSKRKAKQFRHDLRTLVNEGVVLRVKGGRYTWFNSQQRIEGKLVLNRKGFGFVLRESDRDIFVSSRHLKGAIHGDWVEVVLLPYSFGTGPEGQITRIIKRASEKFIGTVYLEKGSLFLHIDPVTPKRGIRILRDSPIRIQSGDVITADVIDWGDGKMPIYVRAIERIGSIQVAEDDMKIICKKFGLKSEFPSLVLREVKKINEEVIKKEIPRRKDLRELICLTIDPVDARDFDDAISLEINSKGNVVLGVHISDVSYFIRKGTELDREARRRGTSVYFAEGTVHMLPETLSGLLCSLLPQNERLTITIFIELDREGNVIESRLYESVIRNVIRLTYRGTQAILDKKKNSPYFHLLDMMKRISQKLLYQRQQLGSIDFDIPEPLFRFREGGIPHEITPTERLDSHRIVEEFMLLANRVIAEKIPVKNGSLFPFIYRIHDRPSKEDVTQFLSVISRLGIHVKISDQFTPKEFRQILGKVEDSPYKNLVETLALRTMTKAIYGVDNRGHYGLAFKIYTHFTSPIRRYPDLIVHRLVKAYYFSEKEEKEYGLSSLRKISKESTEAEINAMEAERDYIKLKQLRWISQHIGQTFHGLITGVATRGLFVELEETLVEGYVPIDWLEEDYFEYDEMNFSLIGRKSGKKYQMGQSITVSVQDVILEEREALFRVVE